MQSVSQEDSSFGFPSPGVWPAQYEVRGATAAANAKVPDQIFKRHGQWKSENAKDGYVKDNLESRFEVSRNIGLYLKICYSFLCGSLWVVPTAVVAQPHREIWLGKGYMYVYKGIWHVVGV